MFSVQPLQPDDGHLTVEAVTRVKDGTASPPVTEAYLARFLVDNSHYLIVATADGGVVDFVLAYRLARIDRDQAVYLHEIDVLPAYRRRGIGTALMEEMLRLCRAEGILKLWLGTSLR